MILASGRATQENALRYMKADGHVPECLSRPAPGGEPVRVPAGTLGPAGDWPSAGCRAAAAAAATATNANEVDELSIASRTGVVADQTRASKEEAHGKEKEHPKTEIPPHVLTPLRQEV